MPKIDSVGGGVVVVVVGQMANLAAISAMAKWVFVPILTLHIIGSTPISLQSHQSKREEDVKLRRGADEQVCQRQTRT